MVKKVQGTRHDKSRAVSRRRGSTGNVSPLLGLSCLRRSTFDTHGKDPALGDHQLDGKDNTQRTVFQGRETSKGPDCGLVETNDHRVIIQSSCFAVCDSATVIIPSLLHVRSPIVGS